jgi:hypothetical protein
VRDVYQKEESTFKILLHKFLNDYQKQALIKLHFPFSFVLKYVRSEIKKKIFSAFLHSCSPIESICNEKRKNSFLRLKCEEKKKKREENTYHIHVICLLFSYSFPFSLGTCTYIHTPSARDVEHLLTIDSYHRLFSFYINYQTRICHFS